MEEALKAGLDTAMQRIGELTMENGLEAKFPLPAVGEESQPIVTIYAMNKANPCKLYRQKA